MYAREMDLLEMGVRVWREAVIQPLRVDEHCKGQKNGSVLLEPNVLLCPI